MSALQTPGFASTVVDISTATPQYITEVLTTAGVSSESVTQVTVVKSFRHSQSIAHLQARFASGTTLQLVLKYCEPGHTAGPDEADFYNQVSPHFPANVLPRCYHAAYNTQLSTISLLLEDLEPEYAPVVAEVLQVPPPGLRQSMLSFLTNLQAHFWNDERLNAPDYWRDWRSQESLQSWFDKRHASTSELLEAAADPLPADVIALYHSLRHSMAGKLARRLSSADNITLVHGDAHGGNFLVSAGATPELRLVDWPNWRPGLPTDDIAYLVAAWPPREQHDALQFACRQFFHQISGSHKCSPDYSEIDWWRDLSLSAGWVFVYCVGLIGECRADWTYELTKRAAALAQHAKAC